MCAIESIKAKNDNFYELLIQNDGKVIRVAASYNRAKAIEALLKDYSCEERLKILKIGNRYGENSLHIAAGMNIKFQTTGYGLESLQQMKELLYSPKNHRSWISLLQTQESMLDTSVHIAAIKSSPDLLNFFSEGLTAEEWLAILSIKNNKNFTAIEAYLFNKTRHNPEDQFLAALKGPLTNEMWVNFLIDNEILKAFNPANDEARELFEDIISNLDDEQIQKLNHAREQYFPNAKNHNYPSGWDKFIS